MQAQAGGFINSSQSSVFNGMAYAGFAAPGSTSAATMFMNPATLTQFKQIMIDSNYTLGVPVTNITGTGPAAFGSRTGSSGDVAQDYVVPATYIVVPLTDRLVAGLSLNSPYGSTIKADPTWAGNSHLVTSKLRTITVTPSLAYKINDWLSVGAGVQIQYMSARQYVTIPGAGANVGISSADGWGIGFTLGATFVPVKGTQIGIGFRSGVDQNVEGTTVNPLGLGTASGVKGTFNLPNRLNVSLRQTINPQLDLLASVEWVNWARLGTVALSANSTIGRNLAYNYKDGWVMSLGGEYKYNEKLTLRAGAAIEISPVTDAVRTLSTPDNDRLWLSAGLTYAVSDRLAVNASYSHIFIKEASLNTAGAGGAFVGKAKAHADLFSLGITSKWGDAPKKEEALVRKF